MLVLQILTISIWMTSLVIVSRSIVLIPYRYISMRHEETLMDLGYLEHKSVEKAHFSKYYFTDTTDCSRLT